MLNERFVGKREFIQHTSRYLKLLDGFNVRLIVTHKEEDDLLITKIKHKSIKELRGFTKIKRHADINEHILPGYDQWLC